ncbi:MAG: ABC transporter ATP-binding protein [Methanomassiliicoccales archaeon]|nr:ABC transporter ATP-binding protein [Methanomassiliicoccales archaeon]
MQLVIDDVRFSYRSFEVLKGISFDLRESEILGVIGPNGSGKTTLLKCINKILEPKQGEILLDGRKIRKMKRIEVARNLGYVPQNAYAGFDSPTVFDVVLMGRRPHIAWQCCERDTEKVWEILTMLGIERLAMRKFDELSGGQQQKVLIARALAQEAKVLLLDEPTSNLDIRHQLEVMNLIERLVTDNGLAGIAAIHDLNLASKYCDKVVMMKEGKIFAAGSADRVLTPENIEKVYGVRVAIDGCHGRPHIVVLEISS